MNKYILHTTFLTADALTKIQSTFMVLPELKKGFYSLKSSIQLSEQAMQTLGKELKCDISKLPEGFSGTEIGLVVTDMDSTLISIECIDEIADMLGIKDKVSAITEAAMRGELDFAASLIQRVALLKGLPVEKLQQVYDERLTLNLGAEKLLEHLQDKSIKIALVSGGFTFFTDKLKDKLGLNYTLANTLEVIDGRLTGRVSGDIIGAQSKADLLLKLSDELGLEQHQVIAMGDGANDLMMMDEAGLSIAYHAKPAVQAKTDVQINYGGLDTVVDLLNG